MCRLLLNISSARTSAFCPICAARNQAHASAVTSQRRTALTSPGRTRIPSCPWRICSDIPPMHEATTGTPRLRASSTASCVSMHMDGSHNQRTTSQHVLFPPDQPSRTPCNPDQDTRESDDRELGRLPRQRAIHPPHVRHEQQRLSPSRGIDVRPPGRTPHRRSGQTVTRQRHSEPRLSERPIRQRP